MQQKTIAWIRAFAIIVGILQLAPVISLLSIPLISNLGVASFVSAVIGLMLLYVGINLKDLIQNKPKFVVSVFWIEFVFTLFSFIFNISNGYGNISRLVILLIEAILVLLILRKIKKLSSPLMQATAAKIS